MPLVLFGMKTVIVVQFSVDVCCSFCMSQVYLAMIIKDSCIYVSAGAVVWKFGICVCWMYIDSAALV